MGCVLRATGSHFDVDQYLAQVQLSALVLKVWREGKRDWPGQKNVYASSGVSILVSDHVFSEVEGQIEDASTFLQKFAPELRLLATFPGVEDIVLDFGIEDRDVAAQADFFPTQLLQRMGELRIGLVVSRYPRDEGVSSASDPASDGRSFEGQKPRSHLLSRVEGATDVTRVTGIDAAVIIYQV